MVHFIGVVFGDHNLLFVGLAAFLCVLACLATFNVVERAKAAAGRARALWLVASGVAGGIGIWSTHFVAMLGFRPELNATYDLVLSALSVVIAILILGSGLALPFALGFRRHTLFACGAFGGLGIAAMHYVGMASYEVAAVWSWDLRFVSVSVLIGAAFAGLASVVGLEQMVSSAARRAAAAGLLVLGIVAMHFTGMAGMVFHSATIAAAGDGSSGWLAGSVALAGILLCSMAFATAIFDQRLVSQQLRDAERLRDSERRLRLLADASFEAIVLAQNDTILDANPRFLEMAAIDEADVSRSRLTAILDGVDLAEASAAPVGGAVKRADGGAVPVEVQAKRLNEADNVWVLALRDMSERLRLEEELRARTERAERAERAKSEFLANMSHEIRTPMNGVMGMAELLAKTELDAKQRTFTDIILRSGSALLTIINDILDFSKIDAGQLELDPQPFRLADAVEDVAALVSARAVEKGLELIVRINPELPEMLVGDVGRLRQIVTNLVGNAVKFTEAGHVLVDVSGRVEKGTAELTVKVVDTGIGIPADKVDRVFEKFSQVDGSSTRKHEGTGLGLTISKLLVEKMGGTIGAESVFGEGSTFWFSVPLPVHGAKTRQKSAPGDMSGARILIVDDNEVNRSILLEQLSSWQFEAAAANSGREALALLRHLASMARPCDLIILDYQMPGMDGGAVTQAIRSDAAIAATPILLLTSVDQPGDGKFLRQLGIDAYLVKPARSSLLLDTIVSVLHEAQQAGRVAAPGGANGSGALVPSPAAAAPVVATAPAAPAGEPLAILVAEDNEVNRLVVEQILADTPHSYALAENGELAFEMWQARRPALVLMDVSMPVMNGLEATKAIRQAEAEAGLARTAIVGLTAHALKGDREMCLEAGMDDYMPKPVSPDRLTAKLTEWLQQSESGRKVA